MFKWPGIPSPKASAEELADFAEFMAWQKTGVFINRGIAIVGEN